MSRDDPAAPDAEVGSSGLRTADRGLLSPVPDEVALVDLGERGRDHEFPELQPFEHLREFRCRDAEAHVASCSTPVWSGHQHIGRTRHAENGARGHHHRFRHFGDQDFGNDGVADL